MNNFTFQNPVKLIFGKGSIAKLAKEIPADKKIMVTFGGGSVKKNGVYDQVVAALKGRDFVEFWGIEPNPKIETLRKAIARAKPKRSIFCSRWAAARYSTVPSSSLRAFPTTAMPGSWCSMKTKSAKSFRSAT